MTKHDLDLDFSHRRNVDPSVLLLSELEILFAQTRLLEVYLKQAKIGAEFETHRIHEGYSAELAALRAEISDRNTALEQFRTTLQQADSRLQDLQKQLHEQQSTLDRREDELQTTRAELASFRAQSLHLELSNEEKEAVYRAAERRRAELEAALAAVRAELEQTALELEAQRLVAREAEDRVHSQLQQLTAQLADKEAQTNAHAGELRKAEEELAKLLQRVGELERERNQAVEKSAQELEETKAAFESQLAGWQAAVEQRDRSIEERHLALAEIERAAQSEINELRDRLADKQQQLQARETELDGLRAQAASLQERVIQSDNAIQQSTIAARDSERIRQQLESEIAGLRSEVAAKEQALANRQANVTALEESLHSRVEELECQLDQARASLDAKNGDAQKTQSEITFLRGRVSELETAVAAGLCTIRETGERHHGFTAEIAGLRATLAERERALAEQEQTFRNRETQLIGERDDLHTRLAAKETELDGHVADLQQARSDIAALIDQKSQLELLQRQTERLLSAQAEQIRQQVRAELADLENRLSEKEEMLRAAQKQNALTEGHLGARISELELELTEKQLRLQSHYPEIDNLKSHVSALSEQLGELESAKRRLEAAAIEAADRLRAQYEAELATLRQELRQVELHLEEQKSTANRLEESRATQLLELQEQLALTRRERDLQLENGRREAAALQERIVQLEMSNRLEKNAATADAEEIRKTYQGQVAILQSELQQKDWAIAQEQAELENLAQQHKEQVQKLEAKLAEEQRCTENRKREFEEAETKSAALRERIAQLETAVEQAQTTAAYQRDQLQQQYEDRLAASQAELAQRLLEIESRARSVGESESAAKIELQRLSVEVQEKHGLLENRNEELLLVKSKMDLLQERVIQLEAEAARKEQAALGENERMRAEFQAQLAFLQAELSQKQWALDERQAAVYGVEQNFSAQIQDLQAELEQKEALLQTYEPDVPPKIIELTTTELTEAQKERFQQMDKIVTAAVGAEASFPASSNRRWRSHFGWKRRWRS